MLLNIFSVIFNFFRRGRAAKMQWLNDFRILLFFHKISMSAAFTHPT